MKNAKLLLAFILLIIAAGLIAQPVQIKFQDPTNATLLLVRQMEPTYPNPTPSASRWLVKAYLTTDTVIDPLTSTIPPEPTGDDTFVMDTQLNFGPGPGALTLNFINVPEADIGKYLYLRFFNATTIENATHHMSFTVPFLVPDSPGNQILEPIANHGWPDPVWQPIVGAPPAVTYTLNITINDDVLTTPGTYTINGNPYQAQLVDNDDEVNDLIGFYDISDAPAGYHWAEDPIEVIATDFDGVTNIANITFLLVADPDTYQYKLTLHAPDDGAYAYTGPADDTTGVEMVSAILNEAVNPYLGTYTITAPCPVDYYEWLPLEVLAGDFALQTKGKNGAAFGQRANGSKALLVYVGEKDFAMQAIDYTFEFTGLPAGATINGGTVFTFTGTAAELFAMTFDILAPGFEPILGYVITPATLLDGGDEIVMDPVQDVYNYYLTLNVDDSQLPVKGTWAITGPAGSYEVIAGTPYPIELLDADTNLLAGEYTIAAATAGYEWVPSVTQTPVFEPMQMPNKETFNYGASLTWTLQPLGNTYLMVVLSSPTQGYTFTGPDPGVTPHSTNPPVNSVALLTGTYEVTDPAPSGYYWTNPSIVVNAGMFAPQPGNPNVFVCTIGFMYAPLQPITYTLNITIDDTVFPGGPYTINGNPYVTSIVDNDDQVNDLLGDYLISDPPAGYHWEVNPITVAAGDFDGNVASIEFVLVEDWNPVELSSFTATLTGQFYVQLSWTSQTETQMMGYRVYRNTSAQQSSSELIDNPMIPATNTSTTQNYTVVDEDVLIGQTYYYWLEAVDYNSSEFYGPVSVTVTGNVPPVLPEVTEMYNAYPNPFKANGSTNIEVSLKAGDTGTLTIYNVIGQIVKTVNLTEGNHMVTWNGRDSRGNACGSGIYFYKLSTQTMNQTKKMVIVK